MLAVSLLALCIAHWAASMQSVDCDPSNWDNDTELMRSCPEFNIFTQPSFEQTETAFNQGATIKSGIVFIKMGKVGGSTLSGSLRRAAERNKLNHARDGGNWMKTAKKHGENVASIWANHGQRRKVDELTGPLMPHAIHVTIVRDRAELAMSRYYWKCNRRRSPDECRSKLDFLHAQDDSSFLNYLGTQDNLTATDVFNSFDFVFVTERFAESTLLFATKYKVPINDLLYIKSKVSGTKIRNHGKSALHIPLSNEPIDVRQAGAKLRNGADGDLYKMANRALDQASQHYGPRFEHDLKNLESKLKHIQNACAGSYNYDCMWGDNGCAQTCINRNM